MPYTVEDAFIEVTIVDQRRLREFMAGLPPTEEVRHPRKPRPKQPRMLQGVLFDAPPRLDPAPLPLPPLAPTPDRGGRRRR